MPRPWALAPAFALQLAALLVVWCNCLGTVLLPRANTRDRWQYKHCRPVPWAHLESCNDEIICLYFREGGEEAGDRAQSSQLKNKHWDSHPVIPAWIGRQPDAKVQTRLMQCVVNSPITFSCTPATMAPWWPCPSFIANRLQIVSKPPCWGFSAYCSWFQTDKARRLFAFKEISIVRSFYCLNYENKLKRFLPNFCINEELLVCCCLVLPEILMKMGYCKATAGQAVALTFKWTKSHPFTLTEHLDTSLKQSQ